MPTSYSPEANRHPITKMFSEKAHPFYNSADIMNLNVIPLNKYTEFATNLFHKFGKEIETESISLAYSTFDGNTYYVQKVIHEAFNQTDLGQEAVPSMIESIIHSMILDNDHKFSEMLSRPLSPTKGTALRHRQRRENTTDYLHGVYQKAQLAVCQQHSECHQETDGISFGFHLSLRLLYRRPTDATMAEAIA